MHKKRRVILIFLVILICLTTFMYIKATPPLTINAAKFLGLEHKEARLDLYNPGTFNIDIVDVQVNQNEEPVQVKLVSGPGLISGPKHSEFLSTYSFYSLGELEVPQTNLGEDKINYGIYIVNDIRIRNVTIFYRYLGIPLHYEFINPVNKGENNE
jgi:hypothetical protein